MRLLNLLHKQRFGRRYDLEDKINYFGGIHHENIATLSQTKLVSTQTGWTSCKKAKEFETFALSKRAEK